MGCGLGLADSSTTVGSVGLIYRPHIDGLRAVAVLVVILFHLDVPGFSGGFIGVDVFFVISGFLITGLIWKEIDATGRFSFKNFYIRRMRRLLPALGATLALSALAAALLLSPERFQQFGRSLGAAALSVSNILFWRESGYFDLDAIEKPLLHTWSLSVEEQFYLVWPALLLFFGRGSAARCIALLAVLAIVSLVFDIYLIHRNPDNGPMTFFLTPFRAYEFAIGGAGVFILRKTMLGQWWQEAAMALGLAMILWSSWAFSSTLPFPYYYALVPCVGTLLVILSPNARLAVLLTNPLSLGIGLISYSAYLVHWPLVVFTHYYTLQPLSAVEKAVIFFATLAFAVVFYFWIEQPFRRPRKVEGQPVSQKRFVTAGLAVIACLAGLGLQIGLSSGWAWRNDKAMTAQQVQAGKERRRTYIDTSCRLDRLDDETCHNDRPIQALVIGDSHEPDGYNILRAVYGDDPDLNLIMFGSTNACTFRFANGKPRVKEWNQEKCRQRIQKVTSKEFLSNLDVVVLSVFRSSRKKFENVWKTVDYFQKKHPGLKVVVFGSYFGTSQHCSELIARFGTQDACKDDRFVVHSPFDDRAQTSRASGPELDYLYLDMSKLACPDGTKESCAMSANGQPAFYDRHHLSLEFTEYLAERIKEQYGDELSRYGFPSPKITSGAAAQ